VIFGRRSKLGRKFDSVFTDLDQSSAEDSAVARNFRFDDRVSVPRERFLESYLRRAQAKQRGLKLPDAFQRYFEEEVRFTHNPRFLRRENSINLMRKFAPEGVKLLRVIDLGQLLPLLRQWETIHPLFRGVPSVPMAIASRQRPSSAGWLRSRQNKNVVEWFERRLYSGTPNKGEDFLRAVLLGLNRLAASPEPEDCFHPAWATTASAVEELRTHDPHQLVHQLGLHYECLPTWIMTLSYPAKLAGGLARPTVLDMPFRCYCHFPSPRSARPNQGGHPMSLAANGADKLVPEFVHRNVALNDQEVDLAWFKIEKPPERKLHDRRRYHVRVLRDHYDSFVDVNRWMPQAVNVRWL
jgi:hypothetical protein